MNNKEYYIDRHDEEKIQFGLDKIYALLKVIDNPQDKLKVIHIAGTNGKGSVASYLATILSKEGYKVGKISSPVIFFKMEFAQIYEFKNGRIEINDALESRFEEYITEYKSHIDSIKTSGYESQIALSFKYLLEEQCDIVIVETGMGGALDATNVFKNTICDVLTHISIDHVGMIGNNLEEIIQCKCGIVTDKGNVVTISSNNLDIIKDNIENKQASLKVARLENIENMNYQLDNNSFEYNKEKYVVALNGRHQIENSIIAIEVINIMNSQGYSISKDSIRWGLKNVVQKARFDKVKDKPIVIADGAHNEEGAKALASAINTYFDRTKHKIVLAISVFEDKEYIRIIQQLKGSIDEIWTFSTDNPRCISSDELYSVMNKLLIYNVKNYKSIENIFNTIDNVDTDTVIVFAGSLSFMKDVYGRLM